MEGKIAEGLLTSFREDFAWCLDHGGIEEDI
jgi:hypothetical protein